MSKIYSYLRVSTQKQSIQLQRNSINKLYNNVIEYEEKFTGTELKGRTEFKKLISKVESGDKIVFYSVSRMSRNAEEGFELYKELFNKGIELEFIKEPYINTTVFRKALQNNIELTGTNVDLILEGINKYLMVIAEEQIKLAFGQAEKEVRDLQVRTKEGIEAKRKQSQKEGKEFNIGRPIGTKLITKKNVNTKQIIKKHSKLFGGELTDIECIKLAGVSKRSFYKYKKEIKEELEGI